ncbi:MAG: TIGR01212 family radical SAM protein [Deltaproteobacteria bacterium]|nr:TIGR01212 family radical SAM protein [Deltaproteobacteria bacterium]
MQRYRDFNTYLKEIFGERVQKISLDAGLDCPNRDGTLSSKGCIFCDRRGSGTGALIDHGISIDQQIVTAKAFIQKRYKSRKFIAYFQSFTNTYAPVPRLKSLYDNALAHKDMVGLSVATRPDCVDRPVLKLISSYQSDHLVWLEYGLQSSHDKTLERIHRGHDVSCFEKSVRMADEYDINICAHIILGLPGEDRKMMLQTARFLSHLPIRGVKIHLLYVIKGTELSRLYHKGEYRCLERDEYANLVVDFLEHLPPDMVIQRLTGDPIRSELVAPSWAKEKQTNLKSIHTIFEKREAWQGRHYRNPTDGR